MTLLRSFSFRHTGPILKYFSPSKGSAHLLYDICIAYVEHARPVLLSQRRTNKDDNTLLIGLSGMSCTRRQYTRAVANFVKDQKIKGICTIKAWREILGKLPSSNEILSCVINCLCVSRDGLCLVSSPNNSVY
jgi:hypothetical protein